MEVKLLSFGLKLFYDKFHSTATLSSSFLMQVVSNMDKICVCVRFLWLLRCIFATEVATT